MDALSCRHVISSAAAHARAFSGTATTTQGEHSTRVESASRYPLASPVRSLSQLDGISKKSVVRRRRLYQRWATTSRKAIFGKRTLREKMELQALQHSCHRSMVSNDPQRASLAEVGRSCRAYRDRVHWCRRSYHTGHAIVQNKRKFHVTCE